MNMFIVKNKNTFGLSYKSKKKNKNKNNRKNKNILIQIFLANYPI